MSEALRGDHRARGHHGDPANSTISNTVTTSVTLGVAPYLNPLTITPTGAIIPPTAATGATALVVPASVSGAIVVNQGGIYGAASFGGVSGIGSAGGMGVQIAAPGTLTNSGTIVGGTGGPSYPVYPPPRGQISRGPGGIGADLTAGGMLMNTGGSGSV